jgi:integrase
MVVGCSVKECPPHVCKPLGNATILKIHFMLSGTLAAAMRWDWIKSNPAEIARKPRQPAPDPDPPTAEQAGQIITAAWEQDDDWGTLVWLVMVTGMRRGEVLRLRWRDVDLSTGTIAIHKSKTHRPRRISIDATTVEALTELRARYGDRVRELGAEANPDAYLFSYDPVSDRPCHPSGVTHRYARMCASIGIDSHLHALRHYAATELLTAGVDLRTVAGRLGHGGGGVTTLRVYAAWVADSDRRAAEILGNRVTRPTTAAKSEG